MLHILCALVAGTGLLPQKPVVSVVSLNGEESILAIREANGDGRLDLIQIEPTGFGYRFMLADGSYPPDFDTFLKWPGEHLAWDLVDIDGDGTFEVVTLAGSGEVRSWHPDGQGGFGEGVLRIASKSYLPYGISRMRFVRDVDGNGRADLVLPAAGQFRIHLQDLDGTWGRMLEIEYEADVSYHMGDPESLDGKFGQSLRIPWFSMEDVDGDGLIDLVSKTDEMVEFHLAAPELSATPSWSLDLDSLSPVSTSSEGFDLDDLFSNLNQGVKWRIEEVDGEAPRDLILQVGGTIKVFHGGSVTGLSSSPDQVLKISGNLVHYFLRDASGDELPDLQLLRVERVGLGQVLRWLVLPGNLEFQFFTYENTKGMFSRKPTRRNTVALKIPRLFSLFDDVEEIGEEFNRQRLIPATRLDLDGDGKRDDVVDVLEGKVLFFHNCAPAEDERFASLDSGSVEGIVEAFLLEDLDRMEDGELRTIDLGGFANWSFSPGVGLRQSTQGKTPSFEASALASQGEFNVRVIDLTGDGRDDVVVWRSLDSGEYLVQFLSLPAAE